MNTICFMELCLEAIFYDAVVAAGCIYVYVPWWQMVDGMAHVHAP